MLDGAQLIIGSINDLEGEVREDIHFYGREWISWTNNQNSKLHHRGPHCFFLLDRSQQPLGPAALPGDEQAARPPRGQDLHRSRSPRRILKSLSH